ncbi:hypothetical protein [Sorangium sp. So ce1024]|uniref:hypothetical protein n=1 Tax=unclassified Sorangium TaxID=2621164 RepID=UPI003EFDDA15
MAKKQVAVSLRKPPSPEKVDAFVAGGADGRPAHDGERPKRAVDAEKPRAAVDRRAVDAEKPAEARQEPAPQPVADPPAAAQPVAAQPAAAQPAQPTAAQPAQPTAAQPVAAQPAAAQPAQPAAASAIAGPQPLATTSELPAVPPVLVGNDGRARRAVTVYLPDPLADRLLLHCIEHDRDMSNLIGEAVEVHLDRRLGPAPVSAAPAEGGAATAREAATDGPGYRTEPFRTEPFRAEPFRAADTGPKGRVGRMVQVGRVLMTLWRQRARVS